MTQEDLAFLIGVAPSYLSFYEQDNLTRTRSPKLNLIRDIGLALKICPNDLIILPCTSCELKNECKKRKYVKDDNEHFFEDNIGYYL